MIFLSKAEADVYDDKFVKAAPNLTPGVYQIRDFFGTDPSVPRIARKFFEDVSNGFFKNIKLVGTRSRDGYIVI